MFHEQSAYVPALASVDIQKMNKDELVDVSGLGFF